MYFVAAILICCSLIMRGGEALALWSLAAALIGYKQGSRARERSIERRNREWR